MTATGNQTKQTHTCTVYNFLSMKNYYLIAVRQSSNRLFLPQRLHEKCKPEKTENYK